MTRILKGRDPNYQKLAIKGLIGNAKRVLQGTKNEDKILSIKDGVKILDDFLNEIRSDQNMSYLPSDVATSFGSPSDKLAAEFIDTYAKKANGRYEHLRTLYPKHDNSKSWDIIRNMKLDLIKKNASKLFNDDGSPTKEHLDMIHWAYSPNVEKLKSLIEIKNGKSSSKKRKSTSDDANVSVKKSR